MCLYSAECGYCTCDKCIVSKIAPHMVEHGGMYVCKSCNSLVSVSVYRWEVCHNFIEKKENSDFGWGQSHAVGSAWLIVVFREIRTEKCPRVWMKIGWHSVLLDFMTCSQGTRYCHIVSQVRNSGNRLFAEEKQPINFHSVYCMKYIFFALPFSSYLMTGCVIPICRCTCPLGLWCVLWAYHWNIPYQKTVLELRVLVRVAAGAIVYSDVLSKHCLHRLEFVWLYWQSCV